jgi:hypothetical protein
MARCTNCNSFNTRYNSLFSWENGAGEMYDCLDCHCRFEKSPFDDDNGANKKKEVKPREKTEPKERKIRRKIR